MRPHKDVLEFIYAVRFNPRTRMGCDCLVKIKDSGKPLFQSTHPHGVRHVFCCCGARRCVSIHAPAWGATRKSTGERFSLSFNPRTRMGCDKDAYLFSGPYKVSIHAPAWGATHVFVHAGTHRMFQSTHPHGVRRITILKILVMPKFQSTHPHGVRLLC